MIGEDSGAPVSAPQIERGGTASPMHTKSSQVQVSTGKAAVSTEEVTTQVHNFFQLISHFDDHPSASLIVKFVRKANSPARFVDYVRNMSTYLHTEGFGNDGSLPPILHSRTHRAAGRRERLGGVR